MKALRALLLAPLLAAACAALGAQQRAWDFVVRLDDKVVGTHRFLVETGAGSTRVTSDARFDVDVLGFTVYRYRHSSRERWQDGCLAGIDANTEDGGTRTHVRGSGSAAAFAIEGSASPVEGCLMTFAYWNDQLPRQTRLLDPGTGKIVPVNIDRIAQRRWRISGLPNPIEIEWDDQRWIALDTVVSGRRLTYRLQ